ncbi:MAG: sigma-70 family RNA polymerase sigma factor [Acidobacteria bacterium]|nr:MAG: sigma-70 family RNA polymerase sigma factor [Acidobacteriota bacterium]
MRHNRRSCSSFGGVDVDYTRLLSSPWRPFHETTAGTRHAGSSRALLWPRPAPMSNFPQTRWSVVLACGEDDLQQSQAALGALCEWYWRPLYAFVRRRGFKPDPAADLTQAFFVHLLDKDALLRVDPEKGRFRSFLLASLSNFLSNEWQRERAEKRSPGTPLISLDAEDEEVWYRREPVDGLTPEDVFERRWALTVIGRALQRLAAQQQELGQADRFALLRGYVTGAGPRPAYSDVASQLEITESAVRVAVRRLRQSFGRALRAEVAETVSESDAVDAEVRHLLRVIEASNQSLGPDGAPGEP